MTREDVDPRALELDWDKKYEAKHWKRKSVGLPDGCCDMRELGFRTSILGDSVGEKDQCATIFGQVGMKNDEELLKFRKDLEHAKKTQVCTHGSDFIEG